MKKIIACCGVECTACDAFISTRDNNDELKQKTAALWAQQLDVSVDPEYISCDGCQQTSGRHLAYCAMCGIRNCCLERKLDTCAQCDEYVCERLQKGFVFMSEVLEMGPVEELEAKKNLAAIRNKAP